MPTVLLTGASGFIAGWILRYLLDREYTVIATVRSNEKGEYLKALYPGVSKLSYSVVPDIGAPDAFKDAVVGVDYIIHSASPFRLNISNPVTELLEPAINGTTGILYAAKLYAPQVKKIIITSSFAAIQHVSKRDYPGHVYDETQWNPVCIITL